MRAIRFDELGGPEVLRGVELPDPSPGPGQVLVAVESAAVNFSDIARRRGDPYPDPTPLPFFPGAEVAGTVVGLGDGVDSPAVGTRVFGVAGNTDGGYAELALMQAQNAIPTPDTVDSDVAAGLLVVGLSAVLILTETAGLAANETVFVPAAAGGLGAYAVQIATLLGAEVIAGASTPDKRKVALGHGADHVVDYRAPGWAAEVRDLTGGRGVDVALEMSDPAHLTQTLATLAPFGRLVVYGAAGGRTTPLDPTPVADILYDGSEGQLITGFNLGEWFTRKMPETQNALQRLIGWVATGELKGPTITTLPLAQAADAHRLLEAGATRGKVILKP